MPSRKKLNEDASFSAEQESESSALGNYNVISFQVYIYQLRIEFDLFRWSALTGNRLYMLLHCLASRYPRLNISYGVSVAMVRYCTRIVRPKPRLLILRAKSKT